MKFFKETTDWTTPNHTYCLSDSKDKMFAYVIDGTVEVVTFKNPIRFDSRGRTFKEVKNIWNYQEPNLPKLKTWTVTGSRGDVYTLSEVDSIITCSCPGFKFRGECKHVKELA